MKLLQDNKKLHAEEFSNSSPYIVMFGPDKCGATNKVSLAASVAIELITNMLWHRFISLSGTRTPRLANTRRST